MEPGPQGAPSSLPSGPHSTSPKSLWSLWVTPLSALSSCIKSRLFSGKLNSEGLNQLQRQNLEPRKAEEALTREKWNFLISGPQGSSAHNKLLTILPPSNCSTQSMWTRKSYYGPPLLQILPVRWPCAFPEWSDQSSKKQIHNSKYRHISA